MDYKNPSAKVYHSPGCDEHLTQLVCFDSKDALEQSGECPICRIKNLEEERLAFAVECTAMGALLGRVYNLWLEDADPMELKSIHKQVHSLLEDE